MAARATDADVATMRWLDADRFEITIDLDADLGRAYRVQGSLATRKVSGDTIPRPQETTQEPPSHHDRPAAAGP